jgi:hypothetical protein
MSKRALQEDDLLEIVALDLRKRGFRVLAVGGNQAGLFRFHTKQRKRKAPDLVAYREPVLIVGEAKVRATALFSMSQAGDTDFGCIEYLSKSLRAQREIIDNVRRVLRTLNVTLPESIFFCTALIAATNFPRNEALEQNPHIMLLQVDAITSQITIVRSSPHFTG